MGLKMLPLHTLTVSWPPSIMVQRPPPPHTHTQMGPLQEEPHVTFLV